MARTLARSHTQVEARGVKGAGADVLCSSPCHASIVTGFRVARTHGVVLCVSAWRTNTVRPPIFRLCSVPDVSATVHDRTAQGELQNCRLTQARCAVLASIAATGMHPRRRGSLGPCVGHARPIERATYLWLSRGDIACLASSLAPGKARCSAPHSSLLAAAAFLFGRTFHCPGAA